MPSTRHVAAGAAVVFAAVAVLLAGDDSSYPSRVADDLVLMVAGLIATVSCALAARSTAGRLRVGWWALAAGLLAWTLGEIVWSYQDIVLRRPMFPSVADLFYMSYPVGAGVALLMFWNRRSSRQKARVLLDGVIVAGSLFVVAWLLPISRLYESGSASRLEFAVALGYPALDIVLLTIAASVLINAPARQRLPLTLLLLGLVAMSLGDSGYAFLQVRREYVGGHLLDLCWLAGLLLMTVAAAAGRDAVDDEPTLDEVPGWTSVWLPYLPLMAAGGVLALSPLSATSSGLILGVGVVLTGAVLLRQFLVVDSNRRLMAVVADRALRDPLTGLANRTLFADRLRHALRQRGADGEAVGVMMIDLDDFKLINDTLGHAAGDQLLIGTGQRITSGVRAEDTVARLGGDEFAVLIQAPAPMLESLAHRLVDAFAEPIMAGDHALVMRPSIGLAIGASGQPGLSGEELLHRADLAMYAAKRSRDQSLRIFTDDLPRQLGGEDGPSSPNERSSEDAAEALHQVRLLRRAVRDGALMLVYQPTVDLATGAVVGLEALLRWPHPDRGLLGPAELLPLISRFGLADDVTDVVLSGALDDACGWRSHGIDVPVTVNLFPSAPSMPDLPDRIDRALGARGLPPSALCVDITDEVVGGDFGAARQMVTALRTRGIRVAVDDFGSGPAPLRFLRDLPVDEVKLDRDLIAPITADPRGAAVVLTVIDLARVLGVATVAVGVEDAATAAALRRFDCDMAQGYHFSPPLSRAEVLTSPLLLHPPGHAGVRVS